VTAPKYTVTYSDQQMTLRSSIAVKPPYRPNQWRMTSLPNRCQRPRIISDLVQSEPTSDRQI